MKITLSFLVSLAFALLGIAGLTLVRAQLPFSTPLTAIGGPGTFPAAYLTIIVVVSSVLAVTEMVAPKATESKPSKKMTTNDLVRVLLMVAATIVYMSVLRRTGFLMATPFFTLAMLWLFGYRNLVVSPVVAISFTFILHALFQTFLRIPLP